VIVVGGEALVDLVEERGMLQVVAGGGPFNTAIALGRLGVEVAFLGTLSQDGYGEMLGARLAEVRVDTSLVRRSRAPTPKAVVHRRDHGRNEYAFDLIGTAFGDFPVSGLPALPDDAWALHLGTLALAIDPPADAFEALIDREAGQRAIILDPNVRPLIFGDVEVYRRRFERLASLADIVKLSSEDAAWLYPELTPDCVLELILNLGPQIVAVTLGADGAIAGSGEARVRALGIAIDVADTVGAGDSFGGAFVAALLDGGSLVPARSRDVDIGLLAAAVSFAVTASAITCTRIGADPPTRAEIDEWLTGAMRDGLDVAGVLDAETPSSGCKRSEYNR
jgi:fructokinase